MTWPMHDAGSTTPEPDSGEPELSERGAGPAGTPPPTRCRPWTARCRAAVRARPRRRCRWPSSGRPRPPGLSGPPGLPRQARRPAGSVDAPPGWRRVPRPDGYRPPDDLRPRYPQPGYRPQPGTPGAPGAPGGPGGTRRPRGTRRRTPAQAARPARHAANEPGPFRCRHGGRHPGVPGHRLPAHPGTDLRDRHHLSRQRVQQPQHAAEHRLLPDARRHLHRRGGAAAGPGGQARPGPRRSLYAADVHPGRAGPAGRHRAGHGAGRDRWSP